MMLNGPFGYAPRFQRFLDLLAGGATPPEAWRDCFWARAAVAARARLQAATSRAPRWTRTRCRVAVPKAKKPERERAHGAPTRCTSCWRAFARGTRARASWRRARSWPRRARSPAITRRRSCTIGAGVYALRWRHFDEAERELRAAVALEPSAGAPLAGVGRGARRATSGRGRVARARHDGGAAASRWRRSAQALNFLARYYSERGRVDAGLPFARARGGDRARLLGVRRDA